MSPGFFCRIVRFFCVLHGVGTGLGGVAFAAGPSDPWGCEAALLRVQRLRIQVGQDTMLGQRWAVSGGPAGELEVRVFRPDRHGANEAQRGAPDLRLSAPEFFDWAVEPMVVFSNRHFGRRDWTAEFIASRFEAARRTMAHTIHATVFRQGSMVGSLRLIMQTHEVEYALPMVALLGREAVGKTWVGDLMEFATFAIDSSLEPNARDEIRLELLIAAFGSWVRSDAFLNAGGLFTAVIYGDAKSLRLYGAMGFKPIPHSGELRDEWGGTWTPMKLSGFELFELIWNEGARLKARSGLHPVVRAFHYTAPDTAPATAPAPGADYPRELSVAVLPVADLAPEIHWPEIEETLRRFWLFVDRYQAWASEQRDVSLLSPEMEGYFGFVHELRASFHGRITRGVRSLDEFRDMTQVFPEDISVLERWVFEGGREQRRLAWQQYFQIPYEKHQRRFLALDMYEMRGAGWDPNKEFAGLLADQAKVIASGPAAEIEKARLAFDAARMNPDSSTKIDTLMDQIDCLEKIGTFRRDAFWFAVYRPGPGFKLSLWP